MGKRTDFVIRGSLFVVLCFWLFPMSVIGAESTKPGDARVAGESAEEKSGGLSDGEIDKILDFVKEKWDNGEFSDQESIRKAIEEGEETFGIFLEDSHKDQIADGIEKLDGLGLNHDMVISLTKKIYKEYGDDLTENFQELYKQYATTLTEGMEKAVQEQVVEPVKQAAFSAIKNAVADFFRDLKESVVSFFRNIFSRQRT